MPHLFTASGRLATALAFVAKLMLALIVLLVTADVLARNFIKPLTWAVSLTEYLMLYVTFLAMPALVRGKGHVCADFIRTSLPDALRRVIEKLVYGLCIGICVYLGWVAFQSCVETFRSRAYDVRTFDMPQWLIYLPMVVGLWLSAVEFLRYLLGIDSLYDVDVREMEGF